MSFFRWIIVRRLDLAALARSAPGGFMQALRHVSTRDPVKAFQQRSDLSLGEGLTIRIEFAQKLWQSLSDGWEDLF